MYIAYNLDMTLIHALETNFSKDNIARGLCTLVPFIMVVVGMRLAYMYFIFVFVDTIKIIIYDLRIVSNSITEVHSSLGSDVTSTAVVSRLALNMLA